MSNEYDPAISVFLKLLKAPLLSVRKRRYPSVDFLDDTYLQREEFTECEVKVFKTAKFLCCLGFTVNTTIPF